VSLLIDAKRYVDLMSADYLRRFVGQGASAVKVVVGEETCRDQFRSQLADEARRLGFQYVFVSAAETKVQRPEELFFAISRQIPWVGLGQRFLESSLFPRFELPNGDLSIAAIAKKNNQDRWVVERAVDDILRDRLLRRKGLTGEFRRAIYSVVGSLLQPSSLVSNTTKHVLDWLNGALPSITLVKPAMLYRRIGKNNGRAMTASLSQWLRDLGFPGLVVIVDLSAITCSARSSPGLYYNRATTLDCYESVRQFIDAADRIAGLGIWFVADPSFVDEKWRGIDLYPALSMRLTPDVRDASRPNPYAPMVRLG
jgi:hypothetical protein